MSIVDFGHAAEQVKEFWGLLVDYEHHWRVGCDFKRVWDQADAKARRRLDYRVLGIEESEARSLRRDVLRLQPLVEVIAHELDSTFDYRSEFADLRSEQGIQRARTASERLVGVVRDVPERKRIFSPVGPVLDADGLHPWVWNAAKDLWDGGHYKEAVHQAATAVEQQTSLKIGTDLHGADLYAHAFSLGQASQPRLGFPDIEPGTKRWTSAHQGAMHFGMGCSQGIRNQAAHTNDDFGEQIALEYLAAFSVLARWVEATMVRQPP